MSAGEVFKSVNGSPPGKVSRRAIMPAKTPQFNWDEIIGTAEKILSEQPARSWPTGELVQAVKAGSGIGDCKAMHLGLLPRLFRAGAISRVNWSSLLMSFI